MAINFLNAGQFPDNAKLNFGDSQDLEIFHQSSSSNCFIQNNTGNLRIINNTDDGDITFESDDGSGGVETYFYIDGSASKNVSNKDLRIIDSKDLSLGSSDDMQLLHNGTNSYIQNYTGDLQINSHVSGGDILFRADDGTGSLTTYFYLNGGDTNTNFQLDTLHPDNVKAKFGTSADLQIYHNASNSYISDVGTGILYIQGDNQIRFDNPTSGEKYARFYTDGQVELFYDNSLKFETTNTGVDITGDLNVNAGTDNIVATFNSSDDTAKITLSDNDTNVYLSAKDSIFNFGLNSTVTSNENIELLLSGSKQYLGFGGAPSTSDRFKLKHDVSTNDDVNYTNFKSDFNVSVQQRFQLIEHIEEYIQI